jgi:hypothetical protein
MSLLHKFLKNIQSLACFYFFWGWLVGTLRFAHPLGCMPALF